MKKYRLRKISLLLLVTALMFTVLTGCNSNKAEEEAAFIGIWKMETLEDDEIGILTGEDLLQFGIGGRFNLCRIGGRL